MKEVTKHKKIISLEDPEVLKIPLIEEFGSKPEPVVKPGEEVRKYQLIARSSEGFSMPTHAPVSGIVEKIEKTPQIDESEALTIFIRNDGQNKEEAGALDKFTGQSAGELLQLIEDAGIVGMGGAQFPTAMKYDRKGKSVQSFIINGAECEPYLTGDYALMEQFTKEILESVMLINIILEAEEIIIAFENSNRELEDIFNNFLKKDTYHKIRTQVLSDQYPQGDELQLIYNVTGKELKKDTIPLDYGIIVSNVGTVHAVYNAIIDRKPAIERVITISGEEVSDPGNYSVRIGTPVDHILRLFEIDPQYAHIIGGGPMMSPHIRNLSAPIHKGTLGILALTKKTVDRENCIWCGYCVDVCPMQLMPMKYDQFFRMKRYDKLRDYHIEDCVECSACEYICPSNVPLVESIQKGKSKLAGHEAH